MNFKLCLLLSSVLMLSCGKSKLTDEYEAMVGMYEWNHTAGTDHDIWTNNDKDIYPSSAGYTSAIELTDDGKIIFYKNGEVISSESYSFQDKESAPGNLTIYIKLKGKASRSWDIEQKLKLSLSNDTALSVDKFPFPAIDKAENYIPGYGSNSSFFRRK